MHHQANNFDLSQVEALPVHAYVFSQAMYSNVPVSQSGLNEYSNAASGFNDQYSNISALHSGFYYEYPDALLL